MTNEWISTKESLPDIWVPVIIYSKEHPRPCEAWRAHYPNKPNETWWSLSDDGGGAGASSLDNEEVTHWTPLPKPPKDDV